MDQKPPTAPAAARGRGGVGAAVDACLVAAAMAGASLLAWWALAFHPSNSELWMVPVGLVLACTPAVVYLTLSFSQPRANDDPRTSPPPLSSSTTVVVVVDK
ncbi:hypothetical protein GUJ93_ZPchr0008g12884 [Zizania palustris]|uniref:Uncharacterized protein n=1 Tax=Zizania palustris TaxID=103762 RepID=A0A8J5V450_ZIZPA|nr:hypothetical protein GUJ93_ZPchr0008g12884 [Zizania palustris]